MNICNEPDNIFTFNLMRLQLSDERSVHFYKRFLLLLVHFQHTLGGDGNLPRRSKYFCNAICFDRCGYLPFRPFRELVFLRLPTFNLNICVVLKKVNFFLSNCCCFLFNFRMEFDFLIQQLLLFSYSISVLYQTAFSL